MLARKSAFAEEPCSTRCLTSSSSSSRRFDLARAPANSSLSNLATAADIVTSPCAAARMAPSTSRGPSSFTRYPAAPCASTSAIRSGSRPLDHTTTLDDGEDDRKRLMRSIPASPSNVSSVTITSGRVRAATSTARKPSVETSIASSPPALSSSNCKRATSSGVSQSRTVVSISMGIGRGPTGLRRQGIGGSLNDAGADRDGDRLGAVVRPELFEDPFEMGLHRVRGDPEVARHLSRRGTVGHLLEDLPFPFRQRRRLLALGFAEPRLLDEGLRQLGMDHRVSLHGVAGGIDEGVDRGVLQQIPA